LTELTGIEFPAGTLTRFIGAPNFKRDCATQSPRTVSSREDIVIAPAGEFDWTLAVALERWGKLFIYVYPYYSNDSHNHHRHHPVPFSR
jgi:hypothetical protein